MDLIVAEIDYNIGLTLVSKENPKINIICFNGKLSPKNGWHTWKTVKLGEIIYRTLFLYLVSRIKKGHFNPKRVLQI